MRPAFEPGDRLYAEAIGARSPRPGDVVVVQDPERAGRLILKRVADVRTSPRGPELELRGDRPDASRDSRQFGPVPVDAVVGIVWFRYAPEPRRGPDPGRAVN